MLDDVNKVALKAAEARGAGMRCRAAWREVQRLCPYREIEHDGFVSCIHVDNPLWTQDCDMSACPNIHHTTGGAHD